MPAGGESEEALPFAMNHLPDYFKEKAQRELNETPEKRIAGLKELKAMAKDCKLVCDVDFVDDFLVQFLRHRKYDVSRAYKQLSNFALFVKNYSSLFLSINNDLFFSHPLRQYCTILPRRCPEGCTIVLFELGRWDPEEVSFHEFEQMVIMLFNQCLRDPMTQINGFKIIHDFTGTSMKHLRYCTPSNVYLLYHGGIQCFPGRYKQIHLVSESLTMKAAWTIFKTFITPKLKQRIFVNSSRKDLLNHFPPSVLPSQYGGLLEDYYTMEWTKDANKQQEQFTIQGQHNYY